MNGSDPPLVDTVPSLRREKVALQAEIERLRALNDEQQEIMDGTERREAEYLALIEKHATEVEQLKAEADKSWLKREELYAEINKLKTENEARRVQLEATKREAEKIVYDSGFKLGEAYKEIERLKLSRANVKRAIEELLERYGQVAADGGLK